MNGEIFMKKILTAVPIILICLITSIFLISCFIICDNPYLTHNTLLHENITSLYETEEFHLNDMIPFDWDKMYSFKPGTSKEYIEKTIGISHSKIYDVPSSEDTVCLIFVKDGKITAYPCGSAKDLGYKVNIEMQYENHGVISQHEWPVFVAETFDGIINLTDIMLYMTGDFKIT